MADHSTPEDHTRSMLTHTMERTMQLELLCKTQSMQINNLETNLQNAESQLAIVKDMMAALKEMYDSLDRQVHPGKNWEGGPL